jgi:hypothetical protein
MDLCHEVNDGSCGGRSVGKEGGRYRYGTGSWSIKCKWSLMNLSVVNTAWDGVYLLADVKKQFMNKPSGRGNKSHCWQMLEKSDMSGCVKNGNL